MVALCTYPAQCVVIVLACMLLLMLLPPYHPSALLYGRESDWSSQRQEKLTDI